MFCLKLQSVQISFDCSFVIHSPTIVLYPPLSKTQAMNGKWSQAPWPCRGYQPWAYRYEVPNIQRPRLRTGGKAWCPDPAEICQPWVCCYEIPNIQRSWLWMEGETRHPSPVEEASLEFVVMSKWLRCQRSHLLLQFYDFQTVPAKLHLILTSLTSCSVTTVEQGFLHEQYSNQLLMSYLIKG